MRSRAARALAVVAAAASLGACATKNDIREFRTEMRAEIQALAARQDSLIAQLRVETLSTQDTLLRTQSDQIFDFRGEITRQLRSISQALTTLEAIAGENQRGIAGLSDRLAGSRAGPDPSQPLVGGAPGGPVPGTETIAGAGGGGSADELWSIAREQHQRGSYGTAQAAYEQFLEEHPTHQLAPDAHFFLADILTQQDRPEDALEAFQEIPSLYPTSPRVPDAFYRIARIQVDMGDTEEAAATLERIMGTYPNAPIAMLARDLLDEIR